MSATSALGIRREIVDLIAPLDESIRIGDMALTGLAPLVTEVVGIQEPLSTYRWHGGNITFSEKLTVESVRWRLDMMRAVLDSQRTFLAEQHPELLDRLAPPEASRYLTELEYLEARLEGAPETTALYDQLRATPSYRDQQGLRRRFWDIAPKLPDRVFLGVLNGMAQPGRWRRAVSTVTRRRP